MANQIDLSQPSITQQTENDNKFTAPAPPLKISALPAWAMGMAMGEILATGFIKSDPDLVAALEAGGLTKEDFTNMMKSLEVQVTKSLGESANFIKDLEDDEECAGTAIYKQ